MGQTATPLTPSKVLPALLEGNSIHTSFRLPKVFALFNVRRANKSLKCSEAKLGGKTSPQQKGNRKNYLATENTDNHGWTITEFCQMEWKLS
jgi:hypothetical protein